MTLTPNPALDLWTEVRELQSGPKLRCSAPRTDPGGGGINVSRVLHRLGCDTLAVFASGGSVGARLLTVLEHEGVPADPVEIAAETRESVTVREEANERTYRLVMPGPTLSEAEWRALLDRTDRHARGAALVIASGSLPPGAPGDLWARLADRLRRADRALCLDSSAGVEAALEAGIHLLRQDRNEIEELAGEALEWPGEQASWAEQQVARGACDVVVITHGADGAMIVTRNGRALIRPPETEVESAVGAGDSFMAGLCLALARGDSERQAGRCAFATAVAALRTPGTKLIRDADVERVLARCAEADV